MHHSFLEFRRCCLKSIKISLFGGTIPSLIIQTSNIVKLSFTGESVVRILLNYLVPFFVATYAQYTSLKDFRS